LNFLSESGARLGCVTNGRDFFQRNKISALWLSDLFSTIITSGEFGVKKPDLAIFKEALIRMGSAPHECAFCGDNLYADIEPAHAIGMITILKSRDVSTSESVDYQFSLFSEFSSIWDSIKSR
jgi:HAD superfamily hydrolase (TIGR01509 family)